MFFRLLGPAGQCGNVVLFGECAVEIQKYLSVEVGVFSHPVVGGIGRAAGQRCGRGVRPVGAVVGNYVIGKVVGKAVLAARFGAEDSAELEALDDLEFGVENTADVVVVILVVPPPTSPPKTAPQPPYL